MPRKYLIALLALACSPALADDMKPKIAAQLLPENAAIEISATRTASEQGRSMQVICGIVSNRWNPNYWSSSSFAYVVDDDRLWVTQSEFMKQPEKMAVLKVMKYCPGN
jgi:hypothetical protein